jgi:uncharacterized protein YndB with AHSA1/START domain
MVGVAQWLERRTVAPEAAGSSPVIHPIPYVGLSRAPGRDHAPTIGRDGSKPMSAPPSKTMARPNNPNAVISTERVLSVTPRQIFAAFEQQDRLAQWWGPEGFTNTFEQFEFETGGRWVFVMHGPNGANYPNESIFREIQPDTTIVIEHVVKPWYRLTVTLTGRGDHTHLAWVQEFESPEVAVRMRPLGETANEQVLDRLQSLLASEGS